MKMKNIKPIIGEPPYACESFDYEQTLGGGSITEDYSCQAVLIHLEISECPNKDCPIMVASGNLNDQAEIKPKAPAGVVEFEEFHKPKDERCECEIYGWSVQLNQKDTEIEGLIDENICLKTSTNAAVLKMNGGMRQFHDAEFKIEQLQAEIKRLKSLRKAIPK